MNGVRTIRMVPGRAIDGIADLARDVLGRETFGFFLECEHGWSGVLLCSDARSVREVAEQLGRMAIDNCVHCFADTAGESDR